MFFFFYGSLKADEDGWQEMGLEQKDFTEVLDPEALAPGRMYLHTSASTGNSYPAFVFDPLERELVVGEFHRLHNMDSAKREYLLECLNELEDYRPDDPLSRYHPQEILLYQPKLPATCWTWQQPVTGLEQIYTWPLVSS